MIPHLTHRILIEIENTHTTIRVVLIQISEDGRRKQVSRMNSDDSEKTVRSHTQLLDWLFEQHAWNHRSWSSVIQDLEEAKRSLRARSTKTRIDHVWSIEIEKCDRLRWLLRCWWSLDFYDGETERVLLLVAYDRVDHLESRENTGSKPSRWSERSLLRTCS